ncbi:MAG: class I SAM-dependent methyltransferase [Pseudomonadota bacterium]
MSHRLYEFGLYQIVTPYFWQCPTETLMDNYVENISENHLEVGVGSGYFLKRTLCADFVKRLVLVDLNRNCLEKSATHLQTFAPQLLHHNILEPLQQTDRQHQFSSAGMNYVLHCIPGGVSSQLRVFKHVKSVLRVGGVFFGATLIEKPAMHAIRAWLLMKLLAAVGIFHNRMHTIADLRQSLESHFGQVEITTVGHAAVFRAVKEDER